MAVQEQDTLTAVTAAMTVNQKQTSINVNATIISGKTISIDFDALQGSNPKELGYFVALWQGNQIMGLNSAIATQPVTTTNRSGSIVFEDLSLSNLDYIIGFGVNNKDGNTVCTTISLPKGTPRFQRIEGVPTKVRIVSQSTDSLVTIFETPSYNLPNTNKNWIALFKGNLTANVFKGTNVIKTTMIGGNSNTGDQGMNAIPDGLVRFEAYTLVYGMGVNTATGNPDFSNIVAATEFSIE